MTGAVTGVISTPPSHSKFLYNSNELCRDGVHLITPTIFLSHKNPFNNIDEGGSEFCGEFFYKPSDFVNLEKFDRCIPSILAAWAFLPPAWERACMTVSF